jgi:periplasmic protein TonB
VYWSTEVPPSFPGGSDKLQVFLENNLVYPEIELENGGTGIVVVEFVVHADGFISDIKIIEGVSPHFDKEAIRLVRKMPKWNPAMQNGKPVSCYTSVPIRFDLNEE